MGKCAFLLKKREGGMMVSECQNPDKCREKMRKREQFLLANLPLWQEKWENIQQEKIKNMKIIQSKHFKRRSLSRSISEYDILDVIHNGWAIEYSETESWEKFLVLGYTRKYRPLHVALVVLNQEIIILTTYDPKTRPWQWDDKFERRTCFCPTKTKS